MGKRSSRAHESGDNPRKRIKVAHEAPSWEEVQTSRQLQQLLAPSQDAKAVRHGLQSFKALLDSIVTGGEASDGKRQILRQYLESYKPLDDDDTPVYLPDIMEIWSHASQQKNEPILSTVVVVLDVLLRILSDSLQTVPLGLGICRTLLQKRQQELISQNLSADKSKIFIISPTLRMLREALCFDGGAVCKQIFRARSYTFKSLARNMRIKYLGDGVEDVKRPSIRTTAVRFFLSALKFLHPEGKKELLFQNDMVAGLTCSITDDPPYLVLEILDTLRRHVLQDEKIARDAARRLLNSKTLSHIALLYTYKGGPSEDDGESTIEEAAHNFLVAACTLPSSGVLRQDSGFYPKTLNQEESLVESSLGGMTLEQLGSADKFKAEIPVRNEALAELIRNLRPWASVKQSELVVAIFKVAPELVAPYFLNKAFPFEPKLSATWIGYAAFLFNVTSLPVPMYFGWGSGFAPLPPPTSIVLDNILPSPLTQKALSRCFNLKSNLTSFFASQILVLALEKLKSALELHRDPHHSNPSLWMEASQRLLDAFCQRAPSLKDMINSYRSLPEEDLLHRETASRLLRLYYEVIPQVGLMTKIDVTPFVEKAILRLNAGAQDDARDQALSLMKLENLLAISMYTTSMRWFSKSESLQLSPFTALLKIYVEAPDGVSLTKLQEVLGFVAEEQQIVTAKPENGSLRPLLQSLQLLKKFGADETVDIWTYLDNCFSRCVAASVKYREMLLENIVQAADNEKDGKENGPERETSLIMVVILEQLPFLTKSIDPQSLQQVAVFISNFFTLSAQSGEHRLLLQNLLTKIKEIFPKKSPATKLLSLADTQRPRADSTQGRTTPSDTGPARKPQVGQDQGMTDEALGDILHTPDSLVAENSALLRWASKSADELVDDGYARAVICLLSSDHISIRKEALTSIMKMAAKIQQSEHDEKEQIWLLLSELAETVRAPVGAGEPLVTPLVAFACHALDVLRNPLHCLYPKINQFLTRAPSWNADKVPMVHEILTEEPDDDAAFYTQVAWLAAYVLDCLRTPADVNLFYRNRAFGPLFERIFSLASITYMRQPLRTQILRIVYRVTEIEGGSSTLTTRFGAVSWLEAQAAMCDEESQARLYKGLIRRIKRTCDKERIGKWSKGSLGKE